MKRLPVPVAELPLLEPGFTFEPGTVAASLFSAVMPAHELDQPEAHGLFRGAPAFSVLLSRN